jgi:hypothetical protein
MNNHQTIPLTELLWYRYFMKNQSEQQSENGGFPNFGRTAIAGLKKYRRGKHHDLLLKIMEDLRKSQSGFAVKIPLASLGGVTVLNLRSAIVRAASKEEISVATSSDNEYFYVWKA